ncbi:RHS repeat-associated core domain-containing protein [Actinoplanes sp. NPDC049681]|uniref:RHS repeat-associated core domain-containing protein n=1 Tax=Actinoplanes sp. NPDC049681 TaxID=3363905 RepID=UPI0037B6AC6C
MSRRLARTAAATVALLLAGLLTVADSPPGAAAAPKVAYTYDKAGRLTSVTDATGASATYQYDPVGNLTAITRSAPPAATATAVAPAPKISAVRWSAESVRIDGRNFSNDKRLNTVRLDGRYAKITTAGTRKLVVVRPKGTHTNGAITVSTPSGVARKGTQPIAAPRRPRPLSAGVPTADGRAALAGRIQDTAGKPLAGVRVSIDDTATTSAADGTFLLTGLPGGHHEMVIDARGIAAGDHGNFEQGVDLKAGRRLTLPWTTYLPAIDNAHATAIPALVTRKTEVTTPAIPGLKVIIPAGTRIVDEDGQPVRRLSITRMPLDRQPFPGAPGMPLAWTVQPGGAVVKGAGLQVVYPNITNQPAGTRIDYVDNDADRPGQGWAVYGHGRVTRDGASITPDKKTRLHETYLLGVTYDPPCTSADDCPAPGEDSGDGDPVNLSTGLFTMDHTDLAMPDVAPIALTRSYRQNDRVIRSFGVGQSDAFNLFMAPDSAGNYLLGLPDGSSIRFVPGTDGVYRAAATPTGYTGAYLSGDNHTDFAVTLRSGTVLTFGSHNAKLIAITDRFGNTTTLDRDWGSGRLQQVTSPNGRWLSFTYGACGPATCITQVSDNIGRSVRYTYDASGRLTTAVNPAGGATTYTWAPCSDDTTCTEMTAVTDPAGIQYLRNTYDANGRVASQTQADGGIYRFAYTLSATGQITTTTVTDPLGVVRRTTFNAAGYAVTDTAAVGTSLQQTTTLTRDATSNLVTAVVDPAGRRSTYTYDADGNVLTSTRLAGTADAVTVTNRYEPVYGRIAASTNGLGKTSTFTYADDATSSTVTETDPLGRRSTTVLLAGQPVIITNALGKTTHLSYLDGAPVAVADPLGRVFNTYFDGAGRPIRNTDALRNVSTTTYDVLNQAISATDPLGNTTSATYDANGNRLSVTDANGHTTRWTYDRMGQVVTRTDALGRTSNATYDLAGRLISNTDQKGSVTKVTYDALDRVVTVGYGATVSSGVTSYRSTVTTTYNAANLPASIADSASGTIAHTYDTADRLTRQTGPQGTVNYTWDKADRRTSMTVAGQTAISYAYDDANQLTSVTQGTAVTRLGYDAAGRRSTLTLPNATATAYGYDDAGQLTSLRYTNGTTTIGDLSYAYDADGRRISMDGTLASTTLPDAVTTATYDAANQLTKLGTTTFTYDANGQLTGDGASTYTWNDRGQLAAISGSTTASFTYDAFGRRTKRTVGAASTGFLYDGADAVQELNGTTPTANIVTGVGVDETYQRTDAAGVHYPIADALGSQLAQTGTGGAVQTSYTYGPFGQTTATGAASSNSSQFTGRENDGTGLYYYRARYYSPKAQRFISADPAGEAASGTNLYAYTANSPTNFTDPSGMILPLLAALAGECAIGAVTGVAVGWAEGALNGRKYSWGQGFADAGLGCLGGMAGFGLMKGASKLPGLLKGVGKFFSKCHSFRGDTKVEMGDGSRRRIADVRAGQRVRATDPKTGRTIAGHVSKVHRHLDTALTDVTVRDSAGRKSVIHTTTAHRFWNAGHRKWTAAGSLAAGDRLQTSDSSQATVVAVYSFAGAKAMYDLTVDGLHTYYVAAGSAPVLVHNCNIGARAAELQEALPAASRGRVTMGVGEGVDASGTTRTVIGTSEPNGYLRPGVRDMVRPGEEVATGTGHAEANILDYMKANGITPGQVGAGRPICPACASAIENAGARPGSPLK